MTRVTALAVPLLLAASSTTLPAEPAATITVGGTTAANAFVAPGEVRAVHQADLAAQAAGRVADVYVRSGDTVRRGQVLLRIDSPGARATAEAGNAQAAAASTQLAAARADFERAKRLHDKQYLSDAALQRAEAQLKTVEAQSTAASAQAKASREMAGWEDLRAPYDGRITAVAVAAGDLASPGQTLVTMYEPGRLRVVAEIPDGATSLIAADRPLTLAIPAGTCSQVPAAVTPWTLVPAIDSRSRSVSIRAELPPAASCVPGTLVDVGVPMRRSSTTTSVPRSAVVHRGELDAVYVVDANGRTGLRQVRLGANAGPDVEVLAGLERGEQVVRDAQQFRPPTPGRESVP